MVSRAMKVERVEGPGGLSTRVVEWPAPTTPKALLVIHHGIGEHAARYQSVADGLADFPVDIISYDARGHGEASGKRGDSEGGLAGFARDFDAMLPILQRRGRSERVIVYGHSLGAAIVLTWATSMTVPSPVKGFIFSAPPVVVPRNLVIHAKLAIGRVLGRAVPTLTMPSGLDVNGVSTVKAEVERYIQDPLVHDLVSARLGISAVYDSEKLPLAAGKITLPVLLFQGDADPICDVSGSRRLAKSFGTDDVRYEEFAGGYHETHHESPERRAKLFALLPEWMSPRL
jgi:lysophospholipase